MTSMGYMKCMIWICFAISLSACGLSEEAKSTQTAIAITLTADSWTQTPTRTTTPTITLTPTPTPTYTPSPTSTKTPTRTATATREATQPGSANTWDRYKPRTLREIIDLTMSEAETMSDNTIYLNFGDIYPSQVNMIYTGEFREVDEMKLIVITTWLSSFAPQLSDDQRNELFRTEGKFLEEGVEYWLPVQSQLIPYMQDELTINDEVTLLLVWAGMTKFDDQLEWIFLVNNFPVSP